jgi:GntR family histidine utilization transcriptional repressor
LTRQKKSDTPSLKLDAAKPLYLQVKEFVVDKIRSGEWEDRRIPSESFLVEQFNVSRMTVHRALRELKNERLIIRVPGRGTFLSEEKPRSSLLETQDIAQEIKARGARYHCRVELLEEVPADKRVATALEMRTGKPVFHSAIVHYEGDVAVQFEERWINPAIAPGYLHQDFTRRTPHEYLMLCAQITEVEHILHAIRPDKRAEEMLQLKAAEPCLLLVRRTWAQEGAATWSFFTYPGDRYSLGGRYKVTRDSSSPALASVVSSDIYHPGASGRASGKARK